MTKVSAIGDKDGNEDRSTPKRPRLRSSIENKPEASNSAERRRSDEKGNRKSGNEGTSRSITVTLSDQDILDCPICCEPLCSPIYQCKNGHIACASCCTTMKNKCANCCHPIGYNRCRAFENVIDLIKVTCRNRQRGCKETFSYSKKLAHEKACTYASISCPHIGCDYVGISKSVYAHFAQMHSEYSIEFDLNATISISLDKNRMHAFLQERSLKTVFILNHSVKADGSFINVVCVAPTSEERAFCYDLRVVAGDSSVKLISHVDVMPKWIEQPPATIYVVVPSHLISCGGHDKLELIIWRNPLHNK